MKINKYFIIILTSIISFTSCEDNILDIKPLDQVSDVTFFSTEKELQMALNDVYGSLWIVHTDASESVFLMQYIEAILSDNSLFRITDEHYGLQALSNSTHNSSSGFSGIYSSLYTCIAKTNNILQHMDRAKEKVSEKSFNDIKAQTLTMRAYFYDYLTMFFW